MRLLKMSLTLPTATSGAKPKYLIFSIVSSDLSRSCSNALFE